MQITDNVVAISFGIRYARKFRILDISGDIIDDILYNDKSPFGPKMFPSVEEKSDREKILVGEGRYLRVNTDDIILAYKIKDNFATDINWLENDVLKYYNTLFTQYRINNILRIGIIFHLKFEKDSALATSVKDYIGDLAGSPEGISVRFTEKRTAVEVLLRKKVKDYKNIIYTFLGNTTSLSLDVDYQYYFEPAPEDIRDFQVSKIIGAAKDFLNGDVKKWVEDHYEAK